MFSTVCHISFFFKHILNSSHTLKEKKANKIQENINVCDIEIQET